MTEFDQVRLARGRAAGGSLEQLLTRCLGVAESPQREKDTERSGRSINYRLPLRTMPSNATRFI